MKTLKHSLGILSAVVIFAQAAWVYAYPPDNAAVLYYKAMILYTPDEAMAQMVVDCATGTLEPNDKIREFVVQNRPVLKLIMDAGQIENCDWGLDFSEGLDMRLPHLGRLRSLVWLMGSDARLLAAKDEWPHVISSCMCVYRMARHANDELLISYLVANAIHRLANEGLIEVLGQMPQDAERLTLLKTQFAEIDNIPFSIQPALESERLLTLSTLVQTPEDALRLLENTGLKDSSYKNKIRSFDKSMLDRNIAYCRDYMNGVIAAFDMPYTEGCDAITRLTQKAKEDSKSKPEATFAAAIVSAFNSEPGVIPPYSKMLSNVVLQQTQDNAIRAAIEIYLIKARTGTLPENLPGGLAGDVFSGKPFVYDKTADSFILGCQGKDLSNGETYKYKFSVK